MVHTAVSKLNPVRLTMVTPIDLMYQQLSLLIHLHLAPNCQSKSFEEPGCPAWQLDTGNTPTLLKRFPFLCSAKYALSQLSGFLIQESDEQLSALRA